MNLNLYEILEVSPNASPAVLKTAYRCLVQMLHPDTHPGDAAAAERLALVNHAYSVVADPVLRARYDEKAGLRASDRRGSGDRFKPLKTAPAPDSAGNLRRFVFRSFQ